jgi:hypothetical protein
MNTPDATAARDAAALKAPWLAHGQGLPTEAAPYCVIWTIPCAYSRYGQGMARYFADAASAIAAAKLPMAAERVSVTCRGQRGFVFRRANNAQRRAQR